MNEHQVEVAMHTLHHPPADDLRALLRQDHERLERLYRALMAAFEANDRAAVAKLWTDLERGLLAHLETEEAHILPAFRRVDYAETLALMAEHEQIRTNLAELGVGVDLHLVHADVARRFIDDMRVHAAREDGLVYKWLAHHAPSDVVAGMATIVREKLRAALA